LTGFFIYLKTSKIDSMNALAAAKRLENRENHECEPTVSPAESVFLVAGIASP